MDPTAKTRSGAATADLLVERIRLAVNIAQSECVCQLHLSVCLLTDAGDRAGIQPFVYEPGMSA
jgi:hypothetical protein